MTVYAIEAKLLDVTPLGAPPGSQHLLGRVTVSAQGQGHTHSWQPATGQRYWVGDTIDVEVPDDV